MSTAPLLIGTRGSALALRQARWLAERLADRGQATSLRILRTTGDRRRDRPLVEIGGRGVFVKEIEDALARGEVDLAIHSLKDLPVAQPDGLEIACVPEREDPRDMLVTRAAGGLAGLPREAVVGTGSPRRACQIKALRADIRLRDLRGNVDTRVRRLEAGDYDAIVLAVAGLRRLGLDAPGTVLDLDEMLPAVGQGALAIEIRAGDRRAADAVAPLRDPASAAAVAAERALLRGLGGGCQAPIAAVARPERGRLVLRALVGDPADGRLLRERAEGPVERAEAIGSELAAVLMARGAGALVRGVSAPLPDGP